MGFASLLRPLFQHINILSSNGRTVTAGRSKGPQLTMSIFFTHTRVIWWVTPNEKRNAKVLGVPTHWITAIWGLAFVVPDILKGVLAQVGKPPKNHPPNPHSMWHRIENTCIVFQVFVRIGYTIWAVNFMRMSRQWLIHSEGTEDNSWRVMGWTNVAAAVLLTVSHLLKFSVRFRRN
jgi:hypothetical protein